MELHALPSVRLTSFDPRTMSPRQEEMFDPQQCLAVLRPVSDSDDSDDSDLLASSADTLWPISVCVLLVSSRLEVLQHAEVLVGLALKGVLLI